MSSAVEFPTCIKRLEDVPPPFREAWSNSINENESVVDLMFSPAFRAGKFSTLASVLCVTDNRWLDKIDNNVEGNTESNTLTP
jgi:hypothetical protein